MSMHTPDTLLMGLNTKQKEAVLSTEGPILILAGPGSGKTKTLTHRIAHLIQKGVLPEHILAVTFTNKAAGEMKTRINTLLGTHIVGSGSALFMGTFHSLGVRILRAHATRIGYFPTFTIFDQDDVLSLIKEVMKEREINTKQFAPGLIAHTISSLKSDLVSPEQYAETMGTTDLFPKTVYDIYTLYQKRLKDSNAMDFDDLLMNTCHLFQQHPDILEAYQERFHYIHVDEYQDTDRNQYMIVNMLAKKHRNIAVVGDDAQSIYSFRGADMQNILNFEKDWPDAKIVVLDQNYRSTQVILDAAQGIIGRNRIQKEKNLWTENQGGETIKVTALENERAESEFVVATMESLVKEGYLPKDMVVLYRTNAQSRSIEESLLHHNFPYKIIGGTKFYQRKEVKDILAYIRIIVNPKDIVSLKRIINVPSRGIGKKTFLTYMIARNSSVLPDMRANKTKTEAHIADFDALIQKLTRQASELTPAFFLKSLLTAIHYREYLDDAQDHAEERWENVQELVSLAARYDQLPPPQGIGKLLEDVTLMSEQEDDQTPADLISLMTMHAAKGLEFPVVFIIGLEEGIFPHSRSLFNPHELEEERRLCYVGLTRAKEKVFLTFALSRVSFGMTQVNSPSRFLAEMPQELLEIADNQLEDIYID
ncbi:MAG: UvrD-helicase domain-containing protein [bacterium]|nr:UvrD-helicase domain-containing protein [bacterium]